MDIDVLIYNTIKNSGVDLILSVPCAMLKGLLQVIEEKKEILHIPVTREEEAVGIAAGAYLGNRVPAILMQNSGLGNSINAIKSLLEIYKIPVTFIMSHRGAEGEQVIAQMPMGQATPPLLECINVKTYFIKAIKDVPVIKTAIHVCQESMQSVAILLTRSLWKVNK